MGAFNILTVGIACTNCRQLNLIHIQFKFGDTWQHEYKLGDQLKWGGNDEGMPNLEYVSVYGIAGDSVCPLCSHKNYEEYDIFIENDVIKSVVPLRNIQDYDGDAGGNYCVL